MLRMGSAVSSLYQDGGRRNPEADGSVGTCAVHPVSGGCRERRSHIVQHRKSAEGPDACLEQSGSPPSAGPPGPCPLCARQEQAAAVWKAPYGLIWKRLADEWQVIPTEDIIRKYSPSTATSLFECVGCGLQFFHPASSGGTDFYGLLASSPRYYSARKWEFGWVSERLPPAGAVLDVGCGRGDFLAAVLPQTRRAAGLELDQRTAAEARARGLEVESGDLESFARAHAGEFDAACLFHLVEHLADLRPFIRQVVACLRPGGSLYVSVPNRDRSLKGPFESLDCPPHHLSRWGPRQMERLAGELGLRLVHLELEPVDVTGLRAHFADSLERWCRGKLPGGAFLGRWSARAVRRILFCTPLRALYERTRFFDRAGFRGFTMAAHYQPVESG
jgi:SAM-dependent methyltransferase